MAHSQYSLRTAPSQGCQGCCAHSTLCCLTLFSSVEFSHSKRCLGMHLSSWLCSFTCFIFGRFLYCVVLQDFLPSIRGSSFLLDLQGTLPNLVYLPLLGKKQSLCSLKLKLLNCSSNTLCNPCSSTRHKLHSCAGACSAPSTISRACLASSRSVLWLVFC